MKIRLDDPYLFSELDSFNINNKKSLEDNYRDLTNKMDDAWVRFGFTAEDNTLFSAPQENIENQKRPKYIMAQKLIEHEREIEKALNEGFQNYEISYKIR